MQITSAHDRCDNTLRYVEIKAPEPTPSEFAMLPDSSTVSFVVIGASIACDTAIFVISMSGIRNLKQAISTAEHYR